MNKFFNMLPIFLLVTLAVSIVVLYIYGISYSFFTLISITGLSIVLGRLFYVKKSDSYLEVVKNLDLNFGDNDMVQTVIELDSPDDSLVQQELFEQAHLKLEPLYKKASYAHKLDRDRGLKASVSALLFFVVLCLIVFFMGVNETPKNSAQEKKKNIPKKSGQKSQKDQKCYACGKPSTSNLCSTCKNPGPGKSKEGGSNNGKTKGKGQGKSKGNAKPKSGKDGGKKSDGPKSKTGLKPLKPQGSKKSSQPKPKNKEDKKKLPKSKKKGSMKNSQKKTSPNKSKDWQKSSKGKWDKSSKGRSLGTGKVKDPLIDKRVLTSVDYKKSGEKLLTGVKKMTIPQKYKDKILKIYDEVRKASKNSKNVNYPSNGSR